MPAQAVEVDLGAGEGHRRVDREDPGADRAGRLEDRQAVPAGGVRDVLALADRARWRPSSTTTLSSMSSGTVSSSRSLARATSVGLSVGTPGSSAAIRAREASDSPAAATTSWRRRARRSAAARTAPTRPAPTTPTFRASHLVEPFRSRPSDHPARQVRRARPVWVPDYLVSRRRSRPSQNGGCPSRCTPPSLHRGSSRGASTTRDLRGACTSVGGVSPITHPGGWTNGLRRATGLIGRRPMLPATGRLLSRPRPSS